MYAVTCFPSPSEKSNPSSVSLCARDTPSSEGLLVAENPKPRSRRRAEREAHQQGDPVQGTKDEETDRKDGEGPTGHDR